MKTLPMKLKVNGNQETFQLRLTAGGQLKLKDKYEEDTMTILFGAITEIEKAIDIFGIALNYNGNTNSITDGEEFYDLLVDNGVEGSDGFTKVMTDIAIYSGIIKKEQANTIVNSVTKTFDKVFNDLEEKVTEEDTPTVKEEHPNY